MTKQNTANAASSSCRPTPSRCSRPGRRWAVMKRAAPAQTAPVSPAAEEIMKGWRAWNATLEKPEGDPAADAAYELAAERRDALIDAAEALAPTLDNVLAKALAICWLEYAAEVSPKKCRSEQSFTGRLALDIHGAIAGAATARVTDPLGSSSVIEGRLPAPGHDLSELSIVDLARLYPVIVLAEEVLSSAANAPCFSFDDKAVFTLGGEIIDREADRLSQFASTIAREISRRRPVVASEAEERANTLLSHMLLTGGVAEHPELVAQISATWGA